MTEKRRSGWLKNQLGRRNLSDFQFKLLVGQEYELEKRLVGGDKRSDVYKESLPHFEAVIPERTSERIAKEHNISRATVERSADLYKSHQAVKEVAPEADAIGSMSFLQASVKMTQNYLRNR